MTPRILESKSDQGGDRIVDFDLSDDKRVVRVGERCDAWYVVDLTKTEFASLIADLQALHDQMVE